MHCPNCGSEIPKGEVYCTHCGAKLEEAEERGFFSRHKWLVFFLVILMFGCGMGFGAFRYQKEQEAEQKFVNQCNLVADELRAVNRDFLLQVEGLVNTKTKRNSHSFIENLQKDRAKLAKVSYYADKLPTDNHWSSSVKLIRTLVKQEMDVYDQTIGFVTGRRDETGGAKSLLMTPMAQARATAGRISIQGANFENTADFGKLDCLLDKYAMDNIKQRTISGAEAALSGYFQAMGKRQFRTAYDYFSDAFKKKISYTRWVISYITTSSTKLTKLKSEYVNKDHVSIEYELSSQTRQKSGYVAKKYVGEAELVKVQGKWKIGDLERAR